jgi:hypothetical protein
VTERTDSESAPHPSECLNALVGAWELEGTDPTAPPTLIRGGCTFRWLRDQATLVCQWEVLWGPSLEHHNAGMLIVEYDEGRRVFVGHYNDSEDVFDEFEVNVRDGVFTIAAAWTRSAGRMSEDGAAIAGVWEKPGEDGAWRYWYDLNFRKVAEPVTLSRLAFDAVR